MPPEIMKVENYDYKTEGLQEQNDKIAPRNTEVDPNTKREADNLFSYLRNVTKEIDALKLAMLTNQKRDADQQRVLDAMERKSEYVKRWISAWVEDGINANPSLQEPLYAFIPEGDARLRNLNRNPESAKQVKLETGTVAVA